MKTMGAVATHAVVLGTCLVLGSCHRHDDDHDHGGGGHDHGGGSSASPAVERPTLSVTVYEDGLELFMEYEAFAVGVESPLIAHFTDARDPDGFAWITQGQVEVTLAYDAGGEERFVADTLLRNGIFKPVVKPTRPGKGTLTLKLEGPQHQGTVHAGEVFVHPNEGAAMASAPPEDVGAEPTVGYLKEAQWKTQYATAAAAPRVLMGGIHANGELLPVAGQDAELSSPVAGRLVVADKVPFVGQPVKKGELLASVVPTAVVAATDRATIDLEKSRAESELGLAERDHARAEELFAVKAIPERQLDNARAAVAMARARVDAALRQLALYQSAQGGAGGTAGTSFELRSPIDGVVSFARVTRGAVVTAGERVVAVVNGDKLWLQVNVYDSDVGKAGASPGAVFQVSGYERPFTIDDSNGRRVAVGAVVDPVTRTVPVLFEFDNRAMNLKPGMYAKVTLLTGATVQGVAIPEQAVVDDNGQPTAYVMEGGESFFKRRLKLGVRSGGWVQVLDGVKEGERVVSRGAYEVKLATSAGGIPEHGHQH